MSYFGTAVIPQSTLTLSNGVNNDAAPDTYYAYVTGPTATFSVSGIAGKGYGGELFVLINGTPFAMTLQNMNAGSTAGNRVWTGTGADVTVNSHAMLIYDSTNIRWQLLSYS